MGSAAKPAEHYHELAKSIHNDKYDYSLWVGYHPVHSKVPIGCAIHGIFYQTIANHTKGAGCPICKKELMANGLNKKPIEFFIQKAKKIHNNFYDYSKWKAVQNTSIDTVTIICPIHGPFDQTPATHIDKKAGCPGCAVERRRETCEKKYGVSHPSQSHISKQALDKLSSAVWLYEQHTSLHRTLEDIADELNVQDTTVGRYFSMHGLSVQRFAVSTGEQQVLDFISDIPALTYESNNRTIIAPKELDIWIPSHQLAIEYCGLYWHSDRHKVPEYHSLKYQHCKQKNIRLITLFDDEWKYNASLVKLKLLSILGYDPRGKVFARKCTIVNVDHVTKSTFFDTNHIQGNGPGSINIGLKYDDKLVACMSFIRQKEDVYILNRYATSQRVVGGFSKLLSYFKKTHAWKEIVSFADLRWSQGELYEKSGFVLEKTLPPDYSYVVHDRRVHKFNFRRKFLDKRLSAFDPTLTEMENCDNAGILRVWDCGKLRYVMKNNC